ncbi:bifunctional folylpolyglutamate synthase/dihydrofolate synthase [Catenovulum agarivorans DS-2]|uniref:Dihydrofolate synthase/folylpolyglutamate synthase n=1 Tax=Catenovulum agarivorans DS-2 TaxID=1328313 RepID=W7QJN5_9ALTE|nr:bifunctional tetrahydrofolate synthase/dihydrofolate synthase [Catenovulum agarivorans]EWH12081.1 bifunctional folylpolyglutamate synthase/dihydrofolate synthase [Catenovulum agarivorans DS-2]
MAATACLTSLDDWLDYLGQIHPKEIDMGLERVERVFNRLNLPLHHSRVILVGGTNGKGTTTALTQKLLTAQGFSVGCYNSPHIHDYKERVTIDGQWFTESQHCQAFKQIEQVRADIELTYFEFGTLAALCLLAQAAPDFILLEVGLGGRLDATNIVSPELSVITTVALDHKDWLGDTREQIGFEKAGIFRANGKAVCGDLAPPDSVRQQADKLDLDILWHQQDFSFQLEQANSVNGTTWRWYSSVSNTQFSELPIPNMPLQNASTCLAMLEQLGVSIELDILKRVLTDFQISGRWQQINTKPQVIIDVAHNEEAILQLVDNVQRLKQTTKGQLYAVVGMLKDKDYQTCLSIVEPIFNGFYLADINQARGANAQELASCLPSSKVVSNNCNIRAAYQDALAKAQAEDVIIAFGSFWVITDLLET